MDTRAAGTQAAADVAAAAAAPQTQPKRDPRLAHPTTPRSTGASAEWSIWTTTARIVVSDAAALPRARRIADQILADVELACSRFHDDSELRRIGGAASQGVQVSEMLAALVERALQAADATEGAVDPTLGGVLEGLGYDRDVRMLPHGQHGDEAGFSISVATPREPGHLRVRLVGRILTVPDDLRLDLGATAKAIAADLCATAIADELHCRVLVALGGDIATAGTDLRRQPQPQGQTQTRPQPQTSDDTQPGWHIRVHDLPRDPETTITLTDGYAVATSSTQKRRWEHDGRQQHHILDPRLGLPAPAVWRTVTVAAPNCLTANTLSTAAVVKGRRALEWLRFEGQPARLVDTHGNVVLLNGWPEESTVPARRRPRGRDAHADHTREARRMHGAA